MHTSNLRKVGGSIMITVPRHILELLRLKAGATVGLSVEEGRLIIQPAPRPRYTLDDLLAQCNSNARVSSEEREWLDAPRVGREL